MQWLQSREFATFVRESALTYPTILSLHLVGLGLFGSMVAMTDLRLLGIAMKDRPVADVHGQLRPWKHLGLTLVVICGVILGWSKAATYWPNPYFKTKLTLLLLAGVHALVFRGSVYRNLDAIDRQPSIPGNAKLAAVLSLVIWIGIVTCGRMIGYWEPEGEF
jgi:hypothetical protein